MASDAGGLPIRPGLRAGTGVSISGDWPNELITGGLANWQESVDIAAPNGIIPVVVFRPNNAAPDVDAAIIPKGNGAFLLADPNNAASQGNKRGLQAVDMQLSRGNNTQVAGGAWSGLFSGLTNLASGQASGCFVGNTNTASASNAACLGGSSALASGSGSVTAGGQTLIASGNNTLATGSNGTADALNSSGFGQGWFTRSIIGAMVHSSSVTGGASSGTEQGMHLTLRATTTNAATVIVPTTNGQAAAATNQWRVGNNGATFVQAKVVARNTTTGNLAWWIVSAACKNVAGVVTLSGTVVISAINGEAAMNTCTVTVVADAANLCLQFNVTGIAATTVAWTVEGWSAENTA